MSTQIQVPLAITGASVHVYAQIFDRVTSRFANGTSLEDYLTAHVGNYAVTMTEKGTASGFFVADMPALPAGLYNVIVRQRLGGSPAETDPIVGVGPLDPWNGSSFADGLPARPVKNAALPHFMFLLRQLDGTAAPTFTSVFGFVSLDGGAFTPLTNPITSAGRDGWFKVDLAAAEMNGDIVALEFAAIGCRSAGQTILTQN